MLSLSSGVGSGQVVERGPAGILVGERGNGQSEVLPGGLNNPPEEPVKASPTLEPAQVAVRTDGVVMVSIKEGEGRDFTGRELVTFLLLNPEEDAWAKALLDDAQAVLAARVLARLPKR